MIQDTYRRKYFLLVRGKLQIISKPLAANYNYIDGFGCDYYSIKRYYIYLQILMNMTLSENAARLLSLEHSS
jgi:hypothetical protein